MFLRILLPLLASSMRIAVVAAPFVAVPIVAAPVVAAPVVAAPVVAAPFVAAPIVTAPFVAAPIVAAPIVTAPFVAAPIVAAPALVVTSPSVAASMAAIDEPATGRAYGPAIPLDSVQTGLASYYHDRFEGRRTASGERFMQLECTAAHPWLPFGSVLRVTNLDNRREVLVRVNDRGPFTGGRIIDVSRSAAEELGMIRSGTAQVRIELLRLGNG